MNPTTTRLLSSFLILRNLNFGADSKNNFVDEKTLCIFTWFTNCWK